MKQDANTTHPPRRRIQDGSERGSAMIIALMIMIILTLLGVTFVVLAEQEQQIAVNDRDLAQALYVAEAGVDIAKRWFNNPDPANPFKPPTSELTRDLREGHTLSDPSVYGNAEERTLRADDLGGVLYSGGGGTPFEKPFRGDKLVQFHGRRDTPDVLICQTGEMIDLDDDGTDDCASGANGFMADLNATLLSLPGTEHSARDFGEVSIQQIRVYRPPLDYDLNVRFGIATIEAVAVKKVRGGRIVTRRSVRDVVQEVPFPAPGTAIETEGEIGQSGSFGVHWGAVISSPLNNATDNLNLPNTNANFPQAAIPRDTPQDWGFHHTINPASGEDFGGAASTGGEAFTALTELIGITQNGQKPGKKAFTPPIVGDPWLRFRARNIITYGGTAMGAGPQPYPFGTRLGDFVAGGGTPYLNFNDDDGGGDAGSTWSHMFQRQVVRFSNWPYELWKFIAQSDQNGMYYFQYVAGTDPPEWTLRGSAGQEFSYWVNRVRPGNLGSGVFFFDTADSQAPHDDDMDGIADNLTPGFRFEKVGANEAYLEGFAMAYSEFLNSKGVGNGLPTHVPMPGEPFLDDGIDLSAGPGSGPGIDCICIRVGSDGDCVLGLAPIQWGAQSGRQINGPAAVDARCDAAALQNMNDNEDPAVRGREAATFRNGQWDVDLNSDGLADGEVDASTPGWSTFIGSPNTEGMQGHAFEANRLPHYSAADRYEAGAAPSDWKRDPRFMNHNSDIGGGARQPHEPFVNLDYPTDGSLPPEEWDNGGGISNGVLVDYDAAGDVNGCDKDPASDNRLCSAITSYTTVARDSNGGMMELNLNVNGVLYCEGYYTGTGNVKVFGSMLMRGGFVAGSSIDVWYNEELQKDKWPPVDWDLPRIYTSSRDTD